MRGDRKPWASSGPAGMLSAGIRILEGLLKEPKCADNLWSGTAEPLVMATGMTPAHVVISQSCSGR